MDDVEECKLQRLLDVLPVDGVQPPCHTEEQEQEQQNPHTQALALKLYRFGHPAEEVGQIGNLVVEVDRCLGVNRRECHLIRGAASVALQHFLLDFLEALRIK